MSPDDRSGADDENVVDPQVLAERRARRGEAGETLRDRAAAAEQAAVSLERRLADTEARLSHAQEERSRLATRLERVEKDLTASRQREFAEQRARVEAEGEAGSTRRETQREIARLRSALESAQSRAAALEADVEPLRAELREARLVATEGREGALADDADIARLEGELATARAALVEERAAFALIIDDAHSAFRAELEQHRAAFAAQVEAVERVLAGLRGSAGIAVFQAQERADAEQVLRQRLEAEHRETLAAGARRIDELEQERDAALSDRSHLEAQLRATQEALVSAQSLAADERSRLETAEAACDQLAAELERRQRLEAEVQRAVTALRTELQALRDEQDGRRARDAELEQLVGDLVGTADELRQGFARELNAAAAEREAAVSAEREAFRSELSKLEQRVALLRDELSSAASALRRQLEAEVQARVAAEQALAGERARLAEVEARLSAPSRTTMPAPDHPALVEKPAPAGDAADVIASLGAAAERLRASEPDADSIAGLEPSALPQRQGAELPPAFAPGDRAGVKPWLTPALIALAAHDEAAAARVVLAGAPALATRARKPVTFVLALGGHGTHRVALTRDRQAVVEAISPGEAGEADFSITGSPRAVAVLTGGAAGKLLPEAEIQGRKRRARRLLRVLSEPIGLGELGHAGSPLELRDALQLLVLAVPAEVVGDVAGTVAFDVGPAPLPAINAADGALTVVEISDAQADAVVHPSLAGWLPMLAGEAAVTVSGDAAMAQQVLSLLRSAQR